MSQTSSSKRDPEGRRRKGAFAVGEDTPARRPAWLISLLALLALIAIGLVLFFILHNRNSDSSTPAAAAATATSVPTGSASPTATASDTASASASAGTGGGTAADGQVLAGSQVVVPLAAGSSGSGDLSQYAGQAATARTVAVQSVPADEGFWVGNSASDRVWVQLTGAAGESAVTVKAGDRISFTGGKVVATPAGYAEKVGVDATEGSAQLTAQKAHIEIAKNAIKLTP